MPPPAERAAGVAFLPVDESGLVTWSRPRRFDWASRIDVFPVADSEVLNLSHHCAIAVRNAAGGPTAVCVLGAGLLRSSPINREGRWTPPYAPLALRSMPFRVRMERGNRRIEVAPAIANLEGNTESLRLIDHGGGPTAEYAAILSMLDRLGRGSARLSHAAKLLMAADVLVPIGPLDKDERPILAVVSGERLARLPAHRAAALTADGCAAFDLAAACLFSQRWLAKGIIKDQWPVLETAPIPPRNEMFDNGLASAMEQPFQMDDGALFSFEDFVRATERVDDRN